MGECVKPPTPSSGDAPHSYSRTLPLSRGTSFVLPMRRDQPDAGRAKAGCAGQAERVTLVGLASGMLTFAARVTHWAAFSLASVIRRSFATNATGARQCAVRAGRRYLIRANGGLGSPLISLAVALSPPRYAETQSNLGKVAEQDDEPHPAWPSPFVKSVANLLAQSWKTIIDRRMCREETP
jgi:hypothetical protein